MLIALIAAFVLSGCGSLRLHSEAREKQGVAAKEAWAAVDLSGLVTTERANLKKLLDAELETQDRLAAGIRDHELKAMVGAKSLDEGLVQPVNKLLGTVAQSANRVESSRENVKNFRALMSKLDAIAEEWKAKGIALPTCEAVVNGPMPDKIAKWKKSATETARKELDLILDRQQKACKTPDADNIAKAVYSNVGGAVATAVEQYEADAKALKEIESDAAKRKSEYQDALEEYEKEVAKAEIEADATGNVKKALGRLEKAVGALEAATDALSIQFLSKERLESLDKFVDAVTQAKGDGTVPDGANKATVAFVLLPGLIDDARKSLAEAKKPLALPILIRRNHEQLKFEAASREIEARQTKVRLSKEIVEVLYEQAVQLWMAARDLNNAKVKTLHGQKFTDAFKATGADEKELLYLASARYLDVVNRLSARRYRLEYMRIATSHELSLSYAEVNMKQWQSLIGATVDQVAASSTSGIKAENVSALLNTAGILWIGRGVNK